MSGKRLAAIEKRTIEAEVRKLHDSANRLTGAKELIELHSRYLSVAERVSQVEIIGGDQQTVFCTAV